MHSRRLLPFLRDVLISLANLGALGNHILTLQGRSNALLQLFLPLLGLDLKLEIIIGLFTVYSATVPTRRLLPFLRDVLISLVKKARRAIDTWCMFSSSASLAFTAVIMHFRRLLLPLFQALILTQIHQEK